MDKDTLKLLQDSYKVLANIHNQWQGRHTGEGQLLLCRLRDTIATATNRPPVEVQDEASA